MNPIVMFRGWRDRRWCERWVKEPHIDPPRQIELKDPADWNREMWAASALGGCGERHHLGVGPTKWHAWSALRRELEKH